MANIQMSCGYSPTGYSYSPTGYSYSSQIGWWPPVAIAPQAPPNPWGQRGLARGSASATTVNADIALLKYQEEGRYPGGRCPHGAGGKNHCGICLTEIKNAAAAANAAKWAAFKIEQERQEEQQRQLEAAAVAAAKLEQERREAAAAAKLEQERREAAARSAAFEAAKLLQAREWAAAQKLQEEKAATERALAEKELADLFAMQVDPPTPVAPLAAGSSNNQKRRGIPKKIRDKVWNNAFGPVIKGNCVCCKEEIDFRKWDCAHIKAHKEGGTDAEENLRPTCVGCNRSMGVENLLDFKKRCYPDK